MGATDQGPDSPGAGRGWRRGQREAAVCAPLTTGDVGPFPRLAGRPRWPSSGCSEEPAQGPCLGLCLAFLAPAPAFPVWTVTRARCVGAHTLPPAAVSVWRVPLPRAFPLAVVPSPSVTLGDASEGRR